MIDPRSKIAPSAFVGTARSIGAHTTIWHFVLVGDGASIGSNCTIGSHVEIGRNVVIGDRCKIQAGAFIPEGVVIGDDVFIGPRVVFTNVKRPQASVSVPNHLYVGTTVLNGVSIGANSTIVCGVTLHSGCMVGAGSVVTKDVKPAALVYGNPAEEDWKKL